MQTIPIRSKRRCVLTQTVIIAGVLLQACTASPSQRTGTDPSPVIATPSSRPDSSTHTAFPNVFRAGTLTYDFTTSAIVQSTTGDSIPRTDTSNAAAVITVVFTTGIDAQTIRAAIGVDSARVVGQSVKHQDTPSTYVITALPQRATRISRSAAGSCTLEQSQLLTGDEILPALPIGGELQPQWTDTTRYELCRGGIPLRVTRVAHYQPYSTVLKQQDDSIVIIRSTQVALEGRGTQWQQSVDATGHGASTDTLTIVQQRLAKINGTTSVEITFRSQFRTQSFRQSSHTALRARL